MRRSNKLLEKRAEFVKEYYNEEYSNGKKVSEIVSELSEKLFVTERTIYTILNSKSLTNTNGRPLTKQTPKSFNSSFGNAIWDEDKQEYILTN